MIDLAEIIRMMAANAQAMRAMVEKLPPEQANWKPNPETWSMKEVLDHVYNEERGDFRAHLQEMFSQPPQPWGALQPRWSPMPGCAEALQGFLAEREASIDWLRGLANPDWELASTATFGNNETITLRAGDVLVSWVAHDHLHMRQMNELLFAWNARQGAPYGVEYAGGW